MLDSQLEMTDKIGYLLLKKGIIDDDILEKALATKKADEQKKRRNLAQILVSEFNFDHDTIFREVSVLYAFRELNITVAELSDVRIEEIKRLLKSKGDDVRDQFLLHKVLRYSYDKLRDRLVLAAVDPTDKDLTKIAYSLNIKKFEVNYLRKTDYDKLVEIIAPAENEFLKAIESSSEELNVEIEETNVNEEELDAEINKSALVNLIEASLIEGVRKGASDIHIVPQSGNITEIHFRIDGKLQLWHAQDNTQPEAIMAVVKDRAKGLDRFERESAQDGFIQRAIDNVIIRYRVSVLPTVGTELKNKFESIVIRILDDRKVIKDLSKLGLVGYSNKAFQKAINQPQGMVILTGPTGSGKSTTLVAALYQVIDPTKNILTVEDPVEYVIEGERK